MGTWGMFILLFVLFWVIQGSLTLLQSRHYQRQLFELQRQSSGYLGVGVRKNRWGAGAVAILVTDPAGVVTHCRKLAGVSVFARFRDEPSLVGKVVEDLKEIQPRTSWEQALNMAVEKVEEARQTRAAV
ncbi:transcriptional regulator GutM [Desmospora activa]|uniref:Glucitol operon activator protein n=1 Tax=Desmospora activa DSM 45169 TaxID=1121389 RepID=A0A2T4Z0P1_9BACL|nr:transcriptional regulator GutM [Desmospora activa]PTM53285.1 glucitol operon activator protein [Desmospora activa DSM 45169]